MFTISSFVDHEMIKQAEPVKYGPERRYHSTPGSSRDLWLQSEQDLSAFMFRLWTQTQILKENKHVHIFILQWSNKRRVKGQLCPRDWGLQFPVSL